MNKIIQTIQHTARAAAVLLLALLAAQTAGANDAVTYIDMDGKTKTVTEYTEVTTDMTANGNGWINWSSGTYVVKSSVTLNGCIRYGGEVIDLIVCDGATLTVNGNELNGAFAGNTLNIYAQSNGTGMGVVNVKKHTKCSHLNIAGGQVTLDADGASYGLYVYSGGACGLTVNGGDVTIQNSNGSQGAIYFDGNGFVTLNGGKLTVTNSMGNGYTAIDGRGNNTINFNGGTAVINGRIELIKNINLNSGNVTVNGEIYNRSGYTVTYDFTRATDSYYINAFSNDLSSSATRTVQVKDGAVFLCNGKSYSGTLSNKQISAISGKRMTPDVSDHFSVNDAGTEYTIKTATGWGYFCDMLEGGETFSGKTVELANDITVSRMAGGQPFTGTFDGQNHKLTLAYGTADAPVDAQFVAPFVETARDTSPVFRNLTIGGTIYDGYTGSEAHNIGGLIGHLFGTVTIEHCTSLVEIHAKVGAGGFVGLCEHDVSFTDCHSAAVIRSADGSNSGFVAWSRASAHTIAFTGCLFDGKLLQQNGKGSLNGGFIGWTGATKTVTITNSLCALAPLAAGETMASSGSATFARGWNATTTASNSYYTAAFEIAQGKATRTVAAGTDVTIEAIALTGTATQYTVSGITAYSGGGLQRGETLYYGSDDVVSLTLSNTAPGDVPDGYQYGYTTNAGTLEGSTLTMPDEDVTVSVNTEVLVAIDWATVSTGADKDNAYIIYNKDQLDLLAYRVNGTHGETCQDDGYEGKFFKLAKDISYTHKADGEEGADAENNYEAIGGVYNDGNRYFRGHFDGNNNTISGIRIYKEGNDDADRYQGIFGRTDSGADIHHLTLADARITGYDYTGGIVGSNNGTVSHCHVADDVAVCAVQSDAWSYGGIAGYNNGTIEQCTSAATLTTADATQSMYYGGIAGYNRSRGTLSDNLAIGATVPAAKDNTYGAITAHNNGGSLLRNYYAACKVANEENATDVGCGHISDGNSGRITADVNNEYNPNGAVSIHTLTLADGITTTTAATVTIGTTGYYAQGTAIALSYTGTPGNIPLGYQYEDSYGFTASAGTLEGSTLTMPAADVTVSLAFRSTHAAVPVSYVDAGGTARTDLAIALDGTETDLGSTETDLSNEEQKTWYFVGLPTVAFDHTLYLYGNVHLILADGCTMNVTTSDANGINVDGSLTIYGQTDGTGTLNATGGNGAGITTYSGTITISGGTVKATSGNGTGISTNSGTITISGGRVTATSDNGYGISTDSGNITISGGRVTATGAPGIYTDRGTITLGCTTASDFIYASSYFVGSEGRLNIADGQTLYDEDGHFYSGNGVTIPDGKTLRLYGIALTARQAPDGNYWTTYYNGTLGFTIEGNACAYTATYGAGQLTLHKLGELGKEIPAETAVIIVADNSVVSMTATTLTAYSGPTNALRGVDDDTQTSALGTGTFYVLGMTTVGNEQHFGFHRYTGSEMAAHKAYVLVASSPSQAARSLTMVFDEATGIQGLTPDAAPKPQAAQHWFTLDGRRLQAKPTAPGIYVNNGKKVVIK